MNLAKTFKQQLYQASTCAMRKFTVLVLFVMVLLLFYLISIHYWECGCRQQQKASTQKPLATATTQTSPQKTQQPALPTTQKTTIILYWTKFFEEKDFQVGFGSKPFASCKELHCITTSDRTLFNESDAVIFSGKNLEFEDLPPPGWRRREQNYIYLMLESPMNVYFPTPRNPIVHYYFNRTMTYRRDSDIVYLYGRLKCIDSSPSSNCVDLPHLENAPAPPKTSTTVAQVDFTSKNRTAAWFVSNCDANSRRASLVRSLSEFIPVDVYGKCATANAGKDSPKCSSRPECDTMLDRHHRFYLSFENALCPDYVTEKLYRPLAHGTVPVVFGGANYSLYLPAGSYVNAMDFESPQKLAEHLKRLMTDDKLYSSYFAWRAKYTVEQYPSIGWCELCRLLKDPHVKEKSYSNVGDWWFGETTNQTCFPPPKSLVGST